MMKTLSLVLMAIAYVQAQKLYSVSNAQAERCMNAKFKLATTIDRDTANDGTFINQEPQIVAPGPNARAKMAADELTERSFPNVEWDEGVPLAQWSLDSRSKDANFPLGFRRNVIRPNAGGVMCLKIPAKYQNHKVEVAVETGVKGNICISDTRQAEQNNEANSIAANCDPNGQIIDCFSALQNGDQRDYTQDGDASTPPTQTIDPATGDYPTNVNTPATDASAGFALVIGCPGTGCWENDFEVFYRVRFSAQTWDNSQIRDATTGAVVSQQGKSINIAENQLDMWCMMMEQRDRKLVGTSGAEWAAAVEAERAAAARKPPIQIGDQSVPVTVVPPLDNIENEFPQLFPSDLWAPRATPAEELDRISNQDGCDTGENCPDPAQGFEPSGASPVQMSLMALLLPIAAALYN